MNYIILANEEEQCGLLGGSGKFKFTRGTGQKGNLNFSLVKHNIIAIVKSLC